MKAELMVAMDRERGKGWRDYYGYGNEKERREESEDHVRNGLGRCATEAEDVEVDQDTDAMVRCPASVLPSWVHRFSHST